MDEWKTYNGEGTHPEELKAAHPVEIILRNGEIKNGKTHDFNWVHRHSFYDIVAWRRPMTALPIDEAEYQEKSNDTPSVDNTLTERGNRYDPFDEHAKITQNLKRVMRAHPGWARLSDAQKESLEMIVHKIGRILNGDPNYADNWHDIAGYAGLVDKLLNGVKL